MVIKARGEAIQSFTAALNKAPHLPDGFSTEDLDETIGEAGVGGKNSKSSPMNFWSSVHLCREGCWLIISVSYVRSQELTALLSAYDACLA